MKKKVISMLLVSAMAISMLAGCGGSDTAQVMSILTSSTPMKWLCW